MSYLCETCRENFVSGDPCHDYRAGDLGACLNCKHRRICHHKDIACSACGASAHRWLAIGDITVYLCDDHLDFCAECFRLVDEGIGDDGNVCRDCKRRWPESLAELAYYECRPGCRQCGAS